MTGSLDDATIKHYYRNIELTQSYCTDTHDGYSCSVFNQSITTNYTYSDTSDYTGTVEWEGKAISNGAFSQSLHDGDHAHVCTAANGVIKPMINGKILPGRYVDIIVKGKQYELLITFLLLIIIMKFSSKPPVPLLLFLLWSVVLSLVSLSTGHILLVYLMLMGMWLMLAVSMTIG